MHHLEPAPSAPTASRTRRRRIRRGVIGGGLAALSLLLGLVGANLAWNRAGDMFLRAGYLTSCAEGAADPATVDRCASLAKASDHFGPVPLDDKALTLSYASSISATGSAAMTLGSVIASLLVGLTGLWVAAVRDDCATGRLR
ncbi:MAG: hypothetical protein ACTHMS_05290 [Jatrophihabitans sp.]|uniref:hypothetical protein n=1 Tax=Jatrophihabitans sp. TaxID=1932789 RepID=UPI003F81EE06